MIDSHVYPLALAGVLGLLSLGLMLKSLWTGQGGIQGWVPSKQVIGQILILFVGPMAYIFFFQKLGYLTSTALFMTGILKSMDRKRSLLSILLLSVLVAGGCYGLFVLLFHIQVPPGILI